MLLRSGKQDTSEEKIMLFGSSATPFPQLQKLSSTKGSRLLQKASKSDGASSLASRAWYGVEDNLPYSIQTIFFHSIQNLPFHNKVNLDRKQRVICIAFLQR